QGRDAPVLLGDDRLGAAGDVLEVPVGRRQRPVLEEAVQGLVPSGLPEALLLHVERGEEAVHAAGRRRHLDDQLLAGLDLGQRLPLDLHAGQRLELGDVLLQDVDPGMLRQDQEELLPLEALPVEALGARRGEDERPGRGGGERGPAEAEQRAARERSRERRSLGHRILLCRRSRTVSRRRAVSRAAESAAVGPPRSRATARSALRSRWMVGLRIISSMTVRGGSVTQSRMAAATSSGCIIVARARASGTSGRLSRMGVSTSAGMIVVARMPLSRSTVWTCPMRFRTAAFAAPYGAPPSRPGRMAATDETVTMVPPPRAIMSGSTAWMRA